MPKDELDFAPSKGLAFLAGLSKGVTGELKRRKELEAKKIQSESQLFRQLWPTLFRERGLQTRHEETMRYKGMADELEQMRWKLEFGAELDAEQYKRMHQQVLDARAEVESLHGRLMDLEKLAIEKEKVGLTKEELAFQKATELQARKERGQMFQEMMRQFATTMGLEEKKAEQAAKRFGETIGLAKGRETREEREFKEEMALEREKIGAARTREEERALDTRIAAWRTDVADITSDWTFTEFLTDPTDDVFANAVKARLDALEARRMAFPPDKRPPASEMLQVMETGAKRWGPIPDTLKRWLEPREEPAAPLTSALVVLAKYPHVNWTEATLAAIRKMSPEEKDAFWAEAYLMLRDKAKMPEADIAVLEEALGIK